MAGRRLWLLTGYRSGRPAGCLWWGGNGENQRENTSEGIWAPPGRWPPSSLDTDLLLSQGSFAFPVSPLRSFLRLFSVNPQPLGSASAHLQASSGGSCVPVSMGSGEIGAKRKEFPAPSGTPASSLGSPSPWDLQPFDFCIKRPLTSAGDWEGPEPKTLLDAGERQGKWSLGPKDR